jgi:hypothetical protein
MRRWALYLIATPVRRSRTCCAHLRMYLRCTRKAHL